MGTLKGTFFRIRTEIKKVLNGTYRETDIASEPDLNEISQSPDRTKIQNAIQRLVSDEERQFAEAYYLNGKSLKQIKLTFPNKSEIEIENLLEKTKANLINYLLDSYFPPEE